MIGMNRLKSSVSVLNGLSIKKQEFILIKKLGIYSTVGSRLGRNIVHYVEGDWRTSMEYKIELTYEQVLLLKLLVLDCFDPANEEEAIEKKDLLEKLNVLD